MDGVLFPGPLSPLMYKGHKLSAISFAVFIITIFSSDVVDVQVLYLRCNMIMVDLNFGICGKYISNFEHTATDSLI